MVCPLPCSNTALSLSHQLCLVRFGRDKFQEALKISNRGETTDIDWPNFKFMVFDIPNNNGTYEQRYSLLGIKISSTNHLVIASNSYFQETKLQDSTSKFLEIAPKQICTGTDHLDKIFQDIVDGNGEGVILRDPDAPYKPGRSSGYLKHKVSLYIISSLFPLPLSHAVLSKMCSKKFRDAEAKIVSVVGSHQWECIL